MDQREKRRKLSGDQKAATALMLLGDELAPLVLRHMNENAVGAIARQVAQVDQLDTDQSTEIVERLATDLRSDINRFPVGLDYVRRTLTDAFGDAKAAEVIDQILQTKPKTFDLLNDVDPRRLAEQVSNEAPQLLAVMLGHMKRRAAVAFLDCLPEDKASDVVFRYSQIESVHPAALLEMRLAMTELLGGGRASRVPALGGARQAAELINAMETSAAEQALTSIRAVDNDLADSIRANLFTFDDLGRLTDQTLQMVLREVEQGKLAPALRGASPAMRERILANVSHQTAEFLRDEIENGVPVTRAQAHAGQRAITDATVRLADAGKLSLGGAADML